jgi:WD40 repeat protein
MLTAFLFTLLVDPTPIAQAKLDRTKPVEYEADIKPVFAAKCLVCHAGKVIEGDFDLSTYAAATKGGKRGPAIVPGKPDESALYLFSTHRKKPIMPPKSEDNPLTPVEVALLERWIKDGAKGPAEEAAKPRAVSLSVPAKSVTPVRAVAVAPDASFVAAGRGHLVMLYDAKTGKDLRPLIDPNLKDAAGRAVAGTHVSLVESMAVSPDSIRIATGGFREVTIWDAKAGAPLRRIGGFAHSVVALAYSPDGKTLAAAGGAPTEDGEIKLIDPETGRVTLDIKRAHSDTVFGIAFRPDGKRLATASADKFVKVFDLPSGSPVKSFEGHTQHVLDVAWTPDGKRVISAGADAVLKVWDEEKGEKVRDVPGFGKQVTRLAALVKSPAVLTAAGDGTVKLVNVETGGTTKTYPGGTGFLFAVAGSPDGSVVVAGGEDGVVRIYEGKGGKVIREIGGK